MDPSIDYQQIINNMKFTAVVTSIIGFLVQVAFWTVIVIIVSKYLAKQISRYFDYDYLAQRTAEEVCKRMLIIEKQRKNTEEIEETEEIEDRGYRKAFENFEESSNA